ncbi:MAG: prepilin peptidase [Lachnospiraceae bacterium]|nr:prepilin peptidase [Lachnospiraceae bacterium]
MDFLWYCYIFLIGSIIGSFLNVCILRLPTGESVVTGRSHCPHCNHTLSFAEMIPVLSYLILRGRCRICKAPISIQYPLVEALTALLFLGAALRFGFTPYTLLLCIFFCVLIVLSGIDLRTMEIPDILHLWILGLSLAHLLLSPSFFREGIIGFFLLSVPMLLLSLVTDGFGGGDIKLCAVCGLFLGFRLVLIGFFISCMTAAATGLLLMLRKKAGGKTAFAFGPFLSFGFILSALWGDVLLNAYLSLF